MLNGTLGKVEERKSHLGKLGKGEREQRGRYRQRKGESRRRSSNEIKSTERDPNGASSEKVSRWKEPAKHETRKGKLLLEMLISWGDTISVLDDKDAFMTLGLLFNLISLTRSSHRLVGRGCKVIGSGSAVPNLHISKTILEKLLKLQRNGFLFTLEFVIDEFFQLKVFTMVNATKGLSITW
ncbi:hypothetical protein NE237_007158 [Protea cynaroides]|uniref:Uncharacterized protein n=1 Tax=Protea cynaroides TaxID=273540 RepID=A0A9Q0KNZ0_9MAGN|nr:hypothetical protein NE237_007158 [Protea cynaroides]